MREMMTIHKETKNQKKVRIIYRIALSLVSSNSSQRMLMVMILLRQVQREYP